MADFSKSNYNYGESKRKVTFIDTDIYFKKKNQREKRIVNTVMACHSLKPEILDRLKSSFLFLLG